MKKIRLENLLNIIKKHKSLKAFCLSYDLSYSYINQLTNGTRELGERAARNLEKKIGLPPLTLDDFTDDSEADINTELTKLYATAPETVKYAVSFLLSPPSNGNQFADHITGAINEFSNEDLFNDFDAQKQKN